MDVRRGMAGVLIGLALSASVAFASDVWSPLVPSGRMAEGMQPINAMLVVDCLLPGQVRRSGRISYIGPALPVKTTAELCEKRGGEYVAYDRATVQSTVKVWLDKANDGDADAQLFIGQTYEKGLNQEPDYAQAVTWYRKAAQNGSRQAKLSLAALMEKGQGMPADPDGALKLYREAMGLTEDLVRASEADAKVQEARRQLETQKSDADARIGRLQGEVAALRSARAADARQRQREKESELAQAQVQQKAAVEQLKELPAEGQTRSATRPIVSGGGAEPVTVGTTRFGRYYALVIGVQDYTHFEPLKTPIADAKAVAQVLTERYGFRATTLLDPDYDKLVGTIVQLLSRMGPEDNVLIYFAGHGILQGRQGFWLPLDAQPDEHSPALPTDTVAGFVGSKFNGHSVLIIADACFGSALAGNARVYSGPTEYTPDIPAPFLSDKGRYVLSSGGDNPVLDEGGGGHSVFAAALLKVLRSNQRILTQRGLANALSGSVENASERLGKKQTPELGMLREGKDWGGGAFFLVPKAPAGSG